MKDYTRYSYWLDTVDDDLTPRPALDAATEVDVAILGAGYSGLWTAYYLLRAKPWLRVAVLEQEIAGFGASGRNGGWVSAGFPVSLGGLAERFGAEATRDVQMAMNDAVDEVGRIVAEEGFDAHYRKGGALRLARGDHQLPMLKRSYETASELGLADQYQVLDAEETAARIRVTNTKGALYTPHCAVVHPGRLVRGLARAVERRGGTIYEQTPVTDFMPGESPRLITAAGEVRAGTIVLAGEAYLSRLKRLRRQVIPTYSLIVLTEPLSPEQWKAIGWRNDETVSSMRYSVDYLSRTTDGRILFGGRGAPYRLGSGIADRYDRHQETHAMLRRLVQEWFPMLEGIGFSHVWGGPLGVPRDWMPTIAYDPTSGVATARAYTGQGVATANLAGRILTDLISEQETALTRLLIVNQHSPEWEREPLRWLGVRYVQRGYARIDQEAERTGKAPTGQTLVERLAKH